MCRREGRRERADKGLVESLLDLGALEGLHRAFRSGDAKAGEARAGRRKPVPVEKIEGRRGGI